MQIEPQKNQMGLSALEMQQMGLARERAKKVGDEELAEDIGRVMLDTVKEESETELNGGEDGR